MKNKIKIKTNVKCFGQKLPEGNVCLPSTFLFTLDLIGFGFLYWLAWMYEVSLFNYLKKKEIQENTTSSLSTINLHI